MSRIALRLLSAVPTLFGVILVTFLLTRVLPGDPAVFFAANPSMTAADIAALRHSLGFDQSLPMQFWIYLTALAHGDLGNSVSTGLPVATELARRLPASAELTLFAFLLAIGVAIPLGIAAALRPGSPIDSAARLIATMGVSIPTFVTGLILIYVFYFQLGIAPEPNGQLDPFLVAPPPVTGMLTVDALIAGDFEVFRQALGQLVLPVLTMALFALAPLMRMTRAAMLNALGAEFVRTARASGLRPRTIVFTYAFRNALLPVVTTMGMTFSYMLGANVLVEKVFSWPGIGTLAMNSILNLDYAPLQGFMLVVAGIFIVVNLITDVAAALIDPRAAR